MAKFLVDQHVLEVFCGDCLRRGRRTKLGALIREDPTPAPASWLDANPDREWPGSVATYTAAGHELWADASCIVATCDKCSLDRDARIRIEVRQDRLRALLGQMVEHEARAREIAITTDGKIKLI